MKCDKCQENLIAFLDGELPPSERAEFETHVSQCEQCRSELEDLRKITLAIKTSSEDIELNPGFDARFFHKLADERERGQNGMVWAWIRNQFRWKFPIPVAVAASLIVIVTGYFMTKQWVPGRTDFHLAQNLELMENLDVVRNIDFLENLEVLESYDLYQ